MTTQNLDPEAFGQALRLLRLHGFALVYYGGDALHQAVGAPTEGDVIGKALNKAVLVGAIVGALPLLILAILPLLSGSGPLLTGGGNLMPLIWHAIYAALVSTSAYAQSRGLRI